MAWTSSSANRRSSAASMHRSGMCLLDVVLCVTGDHLGDALAFACGGAVHRLRKSQEEGWRQSRGRMPLVGPILYRSRVVHSGYPQDGRTYCQIYPMATRPRTNAVRVGNGPGRAPAVPRWPRRWDLRAADPTRPAAYGEDHTATIAAAPATAARDLAERMSDHLTAFVSVRWLLAARIGDHVAGGAGTTPGRRWDGIPARTAPPRSVSSSP